MTINSDDPPMFGTSLNREYEIAADLLDLDEAGVAELSRTAVRVSYAPADVKDRILEEIDSASRAEERSHPQASSSERSEWTDETRTDETQPSGKSKALEAHTSQGRLLCTTGRSSHHAATRSAREPGHERGLTIRERP